MAPRTQAVATTAGAQSSALQSLSGQLAARLGVEGGDLTSTLKATAFRQGSNEVTDAQMVALLIVANQYGLNPWTREIYAFPDKGGIVPVVGVDGWTRLINEHPQFDGLEFDTARDGSECTCRIYRKDRSRPVTVTEYLEECSRDTGPWRSHPRRMLRHKALIQAARIAFGYGGIFDEDEAGRIVEGSVAPARAAMKAREVEALEQIPAATLEQFRSLIESASTPEQMRKATEYALRLPVAEREGASRLYRARVAALKAAANAQPAEPPPVEAPPETTPIGITYAQVREQMQAAQDVDALDEAAALIEAVPEHLRNELREVYHGRLGQLAVDEQ